MTYIGTQWTALPVEIFSAPGHSSNFSCGVLFRLSISIISANMPQPCWSPIRMVPARNQYPLSWYCPAAALQKHGTFSGCSQHPSLASLEFYFLRVFVPISLFPVLASFCDPCKARFLWIIFVASSLEPLLPVLWYLPLILLITFDIPSFSLLFSVPAAAGKELPSLAAEQAVAFRNTLSRRLARHWVLGCFARPNSWDKLWALWGAVIYLRPFLPAFDLSH